MNRNEVTNEMAIRALYQYVAIVEGTPVLRESKSGNEVEVVVGEHDGRHVMIATDMDGCRLFDLDSPEQMSRFQPFTHSWVTDVVKQAQVKLFQKTSSALAAGIDRTIYNSYEPKVGDVVTMVNADPQHLVENIMVVAAVLTDDEIRNIGRDSSGIKGLIRRDLYLITLNDEGDVTSSLGLSSKVRKVGHCSEYGIREIDLYRFINSTTMLERVIPDSLYE